MNRTALVAALVSFTLSLGASAALSQTGSQDVYWRIDPGVKTCSMVIDPSLTQDQWHRFTRQVGALSSFKTLAPARTVGRRHFHVAVDYASTPVSQRDPAWINTFVHPDADCPLGDAIHVPTLRARFGLSDRMDIGGYWTKAPGANYGLAGLEAQYAFLQRAASPYAAAVRASATLLTGVPDFNVSVYSLDVLAGRDVARVTPYAGVRTSLVVGAETTSKVNLRTERVPIAQGYVGVTGSLWVLRATAEYDVSTVNTFAVAIGHGF